MFTFNTAIVRYLSQVSATDRCKAVERTYGDRAVMVPSPEPRIEIERISHGAHAPFIQRLPGDCTVAVRSSCIFGHSCTKRIQLLFFIEKAFQTCKKCSMGQRHQLTQTLTHRKATARSLCGCREIAAR